MISIKNILQIYGTFSKLHLAQIVVCCSCTPFFTCTIFNQKREMSTALFQQAHTCVEIHLYV